MLINELDGRVEITSSEAKRMFKCDHPAWQDMRDLAPNGDVYLTFDMFDRHDGYKEMKKLENHEVQIYTNWEKVSQSRKDLRKGRMKNLAILMLGAVMTLAITSRKQDRINQLEQEKEFLKRWPQQGNTEGVYTTPYFSSPENELPSDTVKFVI